MKMSINRIIKRYRKFTKQYKEELSCVSIDDFYGEDACYMYMREKSEVQGRYNFAIQELNFYKDVRYKLKGE